MVWSMRLIECLRARVRALEAEVAALRHERDLLARDLALSHAPGRQIRADDQPAATAPGSMPQTRAMIKHKPDSGGA